MKTKILVGFIVLLSNIVLAQQPDVIIKRCFGGSLDEEERSMTKTLDGNFVLVGTGESNDGDLAGITYTGGVFILKLNDSGDIIWKRRLTIAGYDAICVVQATSDGGFILGGRNDTVYDYQGRKEYGRRFWVVKMNADGNVEWDNKIFGDFDYAYCSVVSIKQTGDGGFIFTGQTRGYHSVFSDDVFVAKLSANGIKEWAKTFRSGSGNYVKDAVQLSDGSYIVSGYSDSHTGDIIVKNSYKDVFLIKLDRSGKILWQKSYGGTKDDEICSLMLMANDTLLLFGTTSSTDVDMAANTNSYGAFVMALDTSGSIKSQAFYDFDYSTSIKQTSDGGFIGAGGIYNSAVDSVHFKGKYDAAILKLDKDFNITWEKILGGTNDEYFTSVETTNNGEFVFTGETNSTDGDITGNHGGNDFWFVKLASPTAIHTIENNKDWLLYPNPNNGKFVLRPTYSTNSKIEIFNILGERIYSIQNETNIDISSQPKGMYFLKITSENGIIEQKIIVE